MDFNPTSSIDLAEVLFTLFWVFFAALVIYIRRQDKREGYPLVSERSANITVEGFPGIPAPKTFLLQHGGTAQAPRDEPPELDVAGKPAGRFPGAPLDPTGDPLVDGLGPAGYCNRVNEPDLTFYGEKRVLPLRILTDFHVDSRDPDPRGMPVMTAEGETVGTVTDLWVDRSEPQIYFLEVDRNGAGSNVLVPFWYANVNKKERTINVKAVYADQFGRAPVLQSPDEITRLEEDRICAYFAGGMFWADDARREPVF
ncbi:MAG: photosynthetic reaction center subunit H [Pseudomonadota bacterium]